MLAALLAAVGSTWIASPAQAWTTVMRSGGNGIAAKLDFDGALVQDIGRGGQLVISCKDAAWSVAVVFPQDQNDFRHGDPTGTISIGVENEPVWSSEAAIASQTGVDISLIARDAGAVPELIRTLANATAAMTVDFRGLFGWRVTATPPMNQSDLFQFSQLPSVCPALKGASLSIGISGETMPYRALLLDKYRLSGMRVTVSDCRLIAPKRVASGPDGEAYHDAIKAAAEARGFSVAANPGQIDIWPRVVSSAEFRTWLDEFIDRHGGELVEPPDPRSDRSPARIRPPGIQVLVASSALECRPTDLGVGERLVLEVSDPIPDDIAVCSSVERSDSDVCGIYAVTGVLRVGQFMRLEAATIGARNGVR